MILVDAQWTEIPYKYMTGKSLQINIVIDYSRKYYSDVKQHMPEKGPPSSTPKPARKPATQVKVKEPSQKKQYPSKATPPLEPK